MARRVTRAPRQSRGTPARLVLDSGAVIALSRDDVNPRAVLSTAVRRGVPVLVPSVVVTETVRGTARDASVNRVLVAVGEIVPIDEPLARAAGALLGSTHSEAGAVDAIVVATAHSLGGAVVLTSDPSDLQRLARDLPSIVIRAL